LASAFLKKPRHIWRNSETTLGETNKWNKRREPRTSGTTTIAASALTSGHTKSLNTLYARHEGKVSDKWSLYIREYDRLFKPYRDRTIRMLEIGIQNGGSLECWSKYFWCADKIVGCDIEPSCAALPYADPRIELVIADINSDKTQRTIAKRGPFDIVIDDGSHHCKDVIGSFVRYFPHVAYGGFYIIEDLHASYWREFGGGLYHPHSSIAFFKSLIDIVNHEHWGVNKSCGDFLVGFQSQYDIHLSEQVFRTIHSVEFLNSLCIIKKQTPRNNSLGSRIVAGRAEAVAPELRRLNGTKIAKRDERSNQWPAENQTVAANEHDGRSRQATAKSRRNGRRGGNHVA
jgi:O-antigen biosynthesis protein